MPHMPHFHVGRQKSASPDVASNKELMTKAEEATAFLLSLSLQQPESDEDSDHDYVNDDAAAGKKKKDQKNEGSSDYVDAEMMVPIPEQNLPPNRQAYDDWSPTNNVKPDVVDDSDKLRTINPKARRAHRLSDDAELARNPPKAMSRKEAEGELIKRGLIDGDFIVRLSDKVQDGYVVSSCHTKSLWHAVLKMTGDQLSYKQFNLGATLDDALYKLQTKIKIEDTMINVKYHLLS